jgi:bilirubin oxidase
MSTRRQVLKGGVAAGAAAAIAGPRLLRSHTAEAATIDAKSIPKYVTPLFIVPAMPPVGNNSDMIEYQVAQRRILAQVLPKGFPKTTINAYGNPNIPSTFSSPSHTLESTANKLTRVTWMNQLVDSSGNFLPHLLTVDPTIHWANPPGGVNGRDSTPTFTSTPKPYTGPQPMIVHMHGSHDFEESDGLPETWFLPAARNIPSGFATTGTDYEPFKQESFERFGTVWKVGQQVSNYPNDQAAGPMWFHDHVLGMTRLDVHTGLFGFNIISGGPFDLPDGALPGPRPKAGDPAGIKYRDIVLSISDGSFNPDGSIFFPSKSDLTGPYIPDSDVPPFWNSSFQGDVALVNGQSWPVLEVEQRRYRFRILDVHNFRAPSLKIVRDPLARPGKVAVPTWVIAADAGGIFSNAQGMHLLDDAHSGIFMVTSERVEIVVDFTDEAVGNELFLINDNVKGGSPGGPPATPLNDVNGIGQLMKFKVIQRVGDDNTLPGDQIHGKGRRNLGNPTETHRVSMNVIKNQNGPSSPPFEVKRFQMGRIDADGTNHLELWSDPISQIVKNGAIAQWEVHNHAGDSGAVGTGNAQVGGGHAFHIHLIEFQVLNRQALDANGTPTGDLIPPSPWELGEKDTVFAPANMVTRFKAPFDLASKYIYHCHFIDHEDHEMMRFWRVQ